MRFYNKRGTAEQWIKKGKQAVKMTRLSCHPPPPGLKSKIGHDEADAGKHANTVEKPPSGSDADKTRRYWARGRVSSDSKLGGNVRLPNYCGQCEAASAGKWKSHFNAFSLKHLWSPGTVWRKNFADGL